MHRGIIQFDAVALDIDAHQVIPRLWIGSAPPYDRDLHPFDRIVLCSSQFQPPNTAYNHKLIRAPFDDIEVENAELAAIATDAANLVARCHKRGERILVTCTAGLNRSALVTALAILKLYPKMTADQVITLIRQRRSYNALFNKSFVALISNAARHT